MLLASEAFKICSSNLPEFLENKYSVEWSTEPQTTIAFSKGFIFHQHFQGSW